MSGDSGWTYCKNRCGAASRMTKSKKRQRPGRPGTLQDNATGGETDAKTRRVGPVAAVEALRLLAPCLRADPPCEVAVPQMPLEGTREKGFSVWWSSRGEFGRWARARDSPTEESPTHYRCADREPRLSHWSALYPPHSDCPHCPNRHESAIICPSYDRSRGGPSLLPRRTFIGAHAAYESWSTRSRTVGFAIGR
uniref:Uncharacterized protein n=1 Tax=Mycena chlorophos TaxID=658473 RepID=A0ABQ0L781_MYCCL|nr:predicted protein [Mycena chlorophos]